MNLFDKKIILTYNEKQFESFTDDSLITERSLRMYADSEEIFYGVDLWSDYDVVDALSDMALSIINGEYKYNIGFDDDDEGQDIGFIKAGRVLQLAHGATYYTTYYTHPSQLISAITELLEQRAAKKESFGKLAEIQQVLQERKEQINEDPQLSLDLKFIDDYFHTADRLKIQWGDSFFYTDTAYTNIVGELLDAAISLLEKTNLDLVIEIEDYNEDPQLSREEKSKYYRPFSISIRPFEQNSVALNITIKEDPWPEEKLIVNTDEFISAVNNMVTGILEHYTVDRFNAIHNIYHMRITFPTDSYTKFKHLLEQR